MMKRNRTFPLWFVVAAALVTALVAYFLVTSLAKYREPGRPRAGASLLGLAGQWVTRPDGRRVCRLSADLRINEPIGPAFCTEWQEPEPRVNQPVEGWMRVTRERGYQIMIEGTWRP